AFGPTYRDENPQPIGASVAHALVRHVSPRTRRRFSTVAGEAPFELASCQREREARTKAGSPATSLPELVSRNMWDMRLISLHDFDQLQGAFPERPQDRQCGHPDQRGNALCGKFEQPRGSSLIRRIIDDPEKDHAHLKEPEHAGQMSFEI